MESQWTSNGISVSSAGAITTIRLDKPALSGEMKKELLAALEATGRDNSVRAVVLTGTGKAFCVGQDLGEHAEALRNDASTAFSTVDAHYSPIVRALTGMPKPVIAAINGLCFGAGLGFALACDLRIAVDKAKFGTAFTGIGLAADSGLSATLPAVVGAARASELLLLSEPFTAAQALEWGILGRVAAADEFGDAVATAAHKLAAGPTLAYAEAKRALWRAVRLEDALQTEYDAQSRLGGTADHQNAVSAFLSKQTPEFIGR